MKVGTHIYKIEFKPDLKDDEGQPIVGQCTNDSLIEIEANDSELLQRSTLFHEIIHAVGYYLDEDSLVSNETKVTALANLLFDVLITNKRVKQFLFKDGSIKARTEKEAVNSRKVATKSTKASK